MYVHKTQLLVLLRMINRFVILYIVIIINITITVVKQTHVSFDIFTSQLIKFQMDESKPHPYYFLIE